MKRNEFFKKLGLGLAALVVAPKVVADIIEKDIIEKTPNSVTYTVTNMNKATDVSGWCELRKYSGGITLKHDCCGGSVYIDTINGESGTIFPIGTVNHPVNNIEDAELIANKYKLSIAMLK